MRFDKSTFFSLSGLVLMYLAVPARATILTFNITDTDCCGVSDNFPEGFPIDQTYGDFVTSTSTTSGTVTFEYGVGAEGFTPNINVSYEPGSIFTGGPSLWRFNYGDLNRVLYQGSIRTVDANGDEIGTNYNYLLLVLFAAPGFEAVLHGFDLGGWNETDYTINSVSVYNNVFNGFFPANNRIFHDPNATIAGAGPVHTTYSFSTPLVGNIISILIDANSLGDDSQYIGIDNIRFGQQVGLTPEVPEPGTLSLFLGGAIAAGLLRRRR